MCQKVIQDELEDVQQRKEQLVLIAQTSVSVSGGAIASKATCCPTVLIPAFTVQYVTALASAASYSSSHHKVAQLPRR